MQGHCDERQVSEMMSRMHKSEIREWVGENVAAERQDRGWSQAELAKRLREALGRPFDQATVARLEKGRRPVDVGEVQVLAEVFDCTAGQLLDLPHRLNWRRVVNAHRRRADAALEQIEAGARDFYEAMAAEAEVCESLASDLEAPLLLLEVGRPDPKAPVRVVVEQILARRPGDKRSAATTARAESKRRQEAEQLAAPLLEQLTADLRPATRRRARDSDGLGPQQ